MIESDLSAQNIILDGIRKIFSLLDLVFFNLMNFMYQLFFNVASADIFSNDMILKFYGRIQVILGVFMMFQLTMSILRGIVNPDEFFESGKGVNGSGFSSIIMRIVTSLLMLALLTPISIPNASNEYEKQINNNGILFGTLYSLQHRILANNTLGRLILGNESTQSNLLDDDSENDSDSELAKSSRTFTSTIVKTFYKINLLPEDKRANHSTDGDDAGDPENRVCSGDIDQGGFLTNYKKEDSDFNEIILSVNDTCDTSSIPFFNAISKALKSLIGSNHYLVAYTYFLGGVTALIFSAILLSFTIDVAIRAIKLAILRLIAPIPIISYMDPKQGKDGSFKAWTKTLSTTYLDLFLRLSIIYFAFFLIESIMTGGLQINTTSGIVGGLSTLIIYIAIFIFAFQAPKFIKEALGIKDSFSLFGGFGSILGGAALAAGTIGSAVTGARSSWAATRDGEGMHKFGALNVGRAIAGGIAGGIGGLATGAKAFAGAKDHQASATMKAMNQRNATSLAAGQSGSTFAGRIGSTIRREFGANTNADILQKNKEANQNYDKYFKSAKSQMLLDKNNKFSSFGATDYVDAYTGRTFDNLKDLNDAYERAKTAGADSRTLKAYDDAISDRQKDYGDAVLRGSLSGGNADYVKHSFDLAKASASATSGEYEISIGPTPDYNTMKTATYAISDRVQSIDAKLSKAKANDRFSGGNK